MSRGISAYVGLRYLGAKRRNQMVSFLNMISMLGLCLGVSLMVAVLSIMNGFDRELRERILGMVPQASIHHRQGIQDWEFVVQQVKRDTQVIDAAPYVQLNGLISHKKYTDTVSIYGIDPQQETKVSLLGDFLDSASISLLENESPHVIVGEGIARDLGVEQGDKILLVVPSTEGKKNAKLRYATVAAVLQTNTELDSQLVLTSLTTAQALSSQPGVSGIRLKLKDLFVAPAVVYNLVGELGFGYYGSNWTRTHGNLYQAIQMSKNMVALLVFLIIAIAAFNIVSTLVMIVIDKEGDIAILRTMGASSRDVIKIFVVLGASIGSVGTFCGIVLGVGLAHSAQWIVAFVEGLLQVQFLKSDVYPLTYMPSEVRPEDIVQVGITALGMCLLATLYPAWRASRVKPAEALRYE